MLASSDQRLASSNKWLSDSALAAKAGRSFKKHSVLWYCIFFLFLTWEPRLGNCWQHPFIWKSKNIRGPWLDSLSRHSQMSRLHICLWLQPTSAVIWHGCLLQSFWTALLVITSNSFPEMSLLSQYTDQLGYHAQYCIEIYHKFLGPRIWLLTSTME